MESYRYMYAISGPDLFSITDKRNEVDILGKYLAVVHSSRT